MVESHRNNNKAYPNNFLFFMEDKTGTWESVHVCHVCKKIWNAATGDGFINLYNHLKNDHGYTDVG